MNSPTPLPLSDTASRSSRVGRQATRSGRCWNLPEPHFSENWQASKRGESCIPDDPPRQTFQITAEVQVVRIAPATCTGEQAVAPAHLPIILMPPGTGCRLAANPHALSHPRYFAGVKSIFAFAI